MIEVLLSFSITLLSLFVMLKTKLKLIAMDKPNKRSMHIKITPRTGGLGIMFGVLVTWIFVGVSIEWFLLPLSLLAISLVDDIHGLKACWRFFVQIIVCSIFIFLHPTNIALWAIPIILLSMVWMVNLYNFMDGSDGLSGGMALFGFTAYAVAANIAGDDKLALLCATLASASFAFLIVNFHPAKIFMGDAGSIPLGFLVSAIGLIGWQQALWGVWFPVLVFSPFIVDATATLVKRLLRRERVWQAHKTHYYQRLVQLGWGHRKTAIAGYVLMFLVGASALLLLNTSKLLILTALLFWLILYFLVMWRIDKNWLKMQYSNSSLVKPT